MLATDLPFGNEGNHFSIVPLASPDFEENVEKSEGARREMGPVGV